MNVDPALSLGERARVRLGACSWWDVAIVGILVLLSAPGGIGVVPWAGAGSDLSSELVYAVSILIFFALLYVLLGRSALKRATRDERPTRGSVTYLVLLVLLIGVGTALTPGFATLQVVAYPMLWTILPRYSTAVVTSGLLALAVGIGSAFGYVRLESEAEVWTAVLTAVLSFVFAVAMGTWITRIFTRGEQHRILAEQLRDAQAEVSELSTAAGAASERERLSRELHDTLTQTLTGLVMLSEQASRSLDAGELGHAQDRLDRVQSAAREAVSEARALVATTQPLGDGGLEAAISRVAEGLRVDTRLQVTCEVASLPVAREDEVVLLRATQEGLANARKHAGASHVTVRLFKEGSDAVLQVQDDGVGIDPSAITHGGFGLSGLVDRVRLAGGEVEISSRPGGGTLLEVRLPVAETVAELAAESTAESTTRLAAESATESGRFLQQGNLS